MVSPVEVTTITLEDKMFRSTDEKQFKRDFVVQWMAAYCASRQVSRITVNRYSAPLHEKDMVVRAKHDADIAWDTWVIEIGLDPPSPSVYPLDRGLATS